LNYVEGFWARNTPGGAWQYNLPEDASEKNLDWKRFLKDKPQVPYDPKRFFRWRCFKDYGTGVCGDLFVHLISSLHFIISSMGPTRIMSTGGYVTGKMAVMYRISCLVCLIIRKQKNILLSIYHCV
jgi:hypothetical protein